MQTVDLEFQWHPGLSRSQKQRSIESLHASAERSGLGRPLEISTKSPDAVGRALSAFCLQLRLGNGDRVSVESVFQAGKVFSTRGPFLDLLGRNPRDAKTDPRLKESGPLVAFQLGDRLWPLRPQTAFYDWIYCSALLQDPELAAAAITYSAFTDIEFNPAKSLNCQARAAALFVALSWRGETKTALKDPDSFLRLAFPTPEAPRGLF